MREVIYRTLPLILTNIQSRDNTKRPKDKHTSKRKTQTHKHANM